MVGLEGKLPFSKTYFIIEQTGILTPHILSSDVDHDLLETRTAHHKGSKESALFALLLDFALSLTRQLTPPFWGDSWWNDTLCGADCGVVDFE